MEVSALIKILGNDNVKELQEGIKDLILQQLREDLRDSYTCIISADDVCDMVDDMMAEIRKEVIAEYKEELRRVVTEAVMQTMKQMQIE